MMINIITKLKHKYNEEKNQQLSGQNDKIVTFRGILLKNI